MTVTEALSSVDYGGDIAGVNFAVVEYKYMCIQYIYIYVYINGVTRLVQGWTQFIYITYSIYYS